MEMRAQRRSYSKRRTAARFRISVPDSIFRSSSIWTAARFPARIPSAPIRKTRWKGALLCRFVPIPAGLLPTAFCPN